MEMIGVGYRDKLIPVSNFALQFSHLVELHAQRFLDEHRRTGPQTDQGHLNVEMRRCADHRAAKALAFEGRPKVRKARDVILACDLIQKSGIRVAGEELDASRSLETAQMPFADAAATDDENLWAHAGITPPKCPLRKPSGPLPVAIKGTYSQVECARFGCETGWEFLKGLVLLGRFEIGAGEGNRTLMIITMALTSAFDLRLHPERSADRLARCKSRKRPARRRTRPPPLRSRRTRPRSSL